VQFQRNSWGWGGFSVPAQIPCPSKGEGTGAEERTSESREPDFRPASGTGSKPFTFDLVSNFTYL